MRGRLGVETGRALLRGAGGVLLVVAAAACGGDERRRANGDAGNGDAAANAGGQASLDGGSGGAGGGVSSGGADPGPDAGTGGARSDAGPSLDAAAPIRSIETVDLLLVIDNSISMADKTAILQQAVPDLVAALTDPESGVRDLHVGVVTSSLGAFGATTCNDADEQKNDRGHLIGTLPRAGDAGPPEGFVTWNSEVDTGAFIEDVQHLVSLTGDRGCGYESTLEALYRFAVDPNPPANVITEPCSETNPNLCARSEGTDESLLEQRRAFFRPDSLVAIVVLTDENDCSMRPEQQLYYPARSDLRMWRASAACADDANDPCCYSCGRTAPEGCEPDPTCEGAPLLAPEEDNLNLRCFDQKRRFGFESLFPVARYVNALRAPRICPANPDLSLDSCPDQDADGDPDIVDNPLFSGAAESGFTREASMVQFLGIVGVPYQVVAASEDATGNPLPVETLRFRTAAELEAAGLWPALVGDRTANPPVPPSEPLLIESREPRSGTSLTGEAIAPPEAGYLENSINGHEWLTLRNDDLQYTCIYPLPSPYDCDAPENAAICDCTDPAELNPLCQNEDGLYGTVQRFAKAYPGLRQLEVMRGLGPNAVVASICARNVSDETADDFGYRPAIATALERWKARLASP